MLDVYVESGVGGHIDNATQAWLFDVEHWGVCGQGDDEPGALADLARRVAVTGPSLRVVERIQGDERAFERDHVAASPAERARTHDSLDACRAETIALVSAAPETALDHDDPDRILPAWATWRTPRQLARHIIETESGYYLAALGVSPPSTHADLLMDLRRSADHVRTTLPMLPDALVVDRGGEVWTTTKVLRRLAWHERGELVVLRRLLASALQARPSTRQSGA